MFQIKSFQNRVFQIGAVALISLSAPAAHAATFTVTNTNNDGAGSLRQAMIDAIATAAEDRIEFNIAGEGVQTIRPASPLPIMSGFITFDGTTQPGYAGAPLIEIDGSSAGENADGLRVVAGRATMVRGLIINRFARHGIAIVNCEGNTIADCYIGTNARGDAAAGNGGDGISIVLSRSNLIGFERDSSDLTAGRGGRNVIGGNTGNGISLHRVSLSLIAENSIGANAGFGIGNGLNGIVIEEGDRNFVGHSFFLSQTLYAFGNVIAANASNGVLLRRTRNNVLTANLIGLSGRFDGIGRLVPTLTVGNGGDGIEVNEASFNTVGGANSGLANFIGANRDCGVRLVGQLASGNVVSSNLIGTDRNGANRGNRNDGVRVLNSSENTIGGERREHVNTIAFNGGNGVLVVSGRANRIALNHIFANSRLGIDLGAGDGPTPNDLLDRDSGANDLLNVPELLSIEDLAQGVSNNDTRVLGRYRGLPNARFRLHFYANRQLDGSGFGEGELYIGFRDIATNVAGEAAFGANFSPGVREGDAITTTATPISGGIGSAAVFAGGTSEFSRSLRLGGDRLGPQVKISSLPSGRSSRAFPRLSGSVRDRSGDEGGTPVGIERVTISIVRRSDGLFFNGSSFQREETTLPTRLEARGTNLLWFYEGALPTGANLLDGTYLISVTAEDNAGRRGRVTDQILIDRVPPVVTFTTPQNGQTVSLISEIRGTVKDNTSLHSLRLLIQRTSDNKYFNGNAFVDQPSVFYPGVFGTLFRLSLNSSFLAPLPDGTYRLTAVAEDRAFNRAVATAIVTQRQGSAQST